MSELVMLLSLFLGVVAAVVAYRELNSSGSDKTVSLNSTVDRTFDSSIVVGSIVATIGILRNDSMLWIGLSAIEIGIIGRCRKNWKRQ